MPISLPNSSPMFTEIPWNFLCTHIIVSVRLLEYLPEYHMWLLAVSSVACVIQLVWNASCCYAGTAIKYKLPLSITKASFSKSLAFCEWITLQAHSMFHSCSNVSSIPVSTIQMCNCSFFQFSLFVENCNEDCTWPFPHNHSTVYMTHLPWQSLTMVETLGC